MFDGKSSLEPGADEMRALTECVSAFLIDAIEGLDQSPASLNSPGPALLADALRAPPEGPGELGPLLHLVGRAAEQSYQTAVPGYLAYIPGGGIFTSALAGFLRELPENDVVLGSRYLHGVTVVNWPLRRLILSYGANAYVRLMTGLPLQDATGGFKAFRREALEAIDLGRIRSDGYSFQVEVNFQLWRQGFRIREIPIVFADRRVGVSKMSRKIIWEAIWMVWRLALSRLFTRVPRNGPLAGSGSAPRDPEFRAAADALLVGADRRATPRPSSAEVTEA